jgi:hypothetical protein
MKGSEEDVDLEPPTLRWLVSCDESGIDGSSPCYGFGTLWMRWQRRGDFHALVNGVRERHHHHDEIKWASVRKKSLPFYLDLVDTFFATSWLAFHCIVVKRADVKKELHDGGYETARMKHFTALLTNKIERCRRANPGREQTFRIWVDPLPSSYKRADDAVEAIANNVLRKVHGGARAVDGVFTHDSKEKPSIQLCDLLLGAAVEGRNQAASAEHKKAVSERIALHLGWKEGNLASDTRPEERKFNIWYFYDPTLGDRAVQTREVKLVHEPPSRSSAGGSRGRGGAG